MPLSIKVPALMMSDTPISDDALTGEGLGLPGIEWGEDGVPRSQRFDDVYFSLHDGWAESRHVFLDGCALPARWRGCERFVVAEAGFGTGRNFLLTWLSWRSDPQRSATLDFISVEGFPLTQQDLQRALADLPDPAMAPLAAELVAAWPVRQPGFHLRLFDGGRVRLLLLFGTVAEVLPQLAVPPGGLVDSWYLDGFAPAKNPDMWSDDVFAQVARLSRPGARFATYAAAGFVRRGLEQVGFAVERRAGFAHKRECLAGRFVAKLTEQHTAPWFAPPVPLAAGARVAIVGAGVAGCALAAALSRRGLVPLLFDRHGQAGTEGSGNPCGLLKPRLTADGGVHGRFYSQATLYAMALLPETLWVGKGIFHLARDAEEAGLVQRLARTLPPGHAVPMDAGQAQQVCGVEAPFGGLWFPHAGAIRPPEVCRWLLEQAEQPIPVRTATAEPPQPLPDGGWLVAGERVGAVVLTAGPFSRLLWPDAELPIHANRGQISLWSEPDNGTGSSPSAALSFGGYLSPRFTDPQNRAVRVLGATYRRWPDLADDQWSVLDDTDHQAVNDLLQSHLPAQAAALATGDGRIGGRAALRATIADHMPLAGPLFSAPDFRADFADLHHGRRWSAYPQPRWTAGLYILGGLGSRGFQTAPLLAEHLAAMMVGAPSPLPQDLSEAVHPARFLVRSLRKPPARKKRAE